MVIATIHYFGRTAYLRSPGCKMWYQRVLETSTTEIIPMTTIEPKAVLQDRQLPMSRPQKRLRIDDEDSDDNPAQFRRVRLRYWDQDQQPESSLALDQGDPIDANAMHDELNQTDLDYLGRLSRFHKQNSTDLSRRLSINNQPLALYELKKAVARCGGFEKVCRLNKWAKIGRDLRCSERITSSPSTLLRDLYQRWLHPYEQYLKVAEPAAATSASNIPADDGQDLRTRQTAFQSQKLRRDSQSSGSDSLIMPRFHPANLNHLSHPIGTIYMPNAQLMYSSDEESDVTEAELPALNARMSQSSQPSHRGTAPSFSNPAIASYLRNREEPRLPQFKAQHSTLPRPEEHQAFSYHGPPPSDIGTSRLSVAGGSAKDTDAFAFSLVNSNPPFHALGSNGVFNERSHAFATPPQLSYESMANNPRPDFSELQQIAASFARQGF